MIVAPAGKHTELVGAYLMEKIPGLQLAPGMFVAFMVVNDEKDFVAGVAFTNYRDSDGVPTDIEVSCASETPAAWRPEVCRAIFSYAFEQLKCVRCTSITVKGNKKARSFLEGLGFQLEGNVRLGYDGRRDALIYGLLRSECRFLAVDSERDDGEKERPEAPASAGPGSDGESAGRPEHSGSDSASEPEPH
jgi:hypothetical protein